MICLLPNCGFLSETSRILEIHRALTVRGVEVTTLTHGGPYVDLLRDHGVEVDVLGGGWNAERVGQFISSIPGIGSPEQSMWTDDEIRKYVALEAEYFRTHSVTAVVTGWTLTALLSSQVAGIPVVVEHSGAFVPPLFERGRVIPPDRRLGLPLEGLMPARVRKFLFNKGLPYQKIYTGGFNRVAAELGVAGIPSFPALLMGDLTLITDTPEVFGVPRHDVDGWVPKPARSYRSGARLRYTGPLFAHFDVPVPARVDSFLDQDGPVAYVALTSTSPELVRAVVGQVRDVVPRVLVAGTMHDLTGLEGDGVLVEQVLPSHRIMPRVAIAVITGGQGSVQTAMAAGTPFVGIALQAEQAASLDIAERHGVARAVPVSRADTEVTEAVRAVLADPRARSAARRISRLYAATDGAGEAADAIVELASVGQTA
ncbi:UDP:flavonoid glycosyltransferase YjiC (YdhE family) [Kribbella sp. VKM Ac-2566]|nr:UDP:flavonoid glycosyltransferase YjiC (YdhE family) [Kribbella sp. VKM Ac-2566]